MFESDSLNIRNLYFKKLPTLKVPPAAIGALLVTLLIDSVLNCHVFRLKCEAFINKFRTTQLHLKLGLRLFSPVK